MTEAVLNQILTHMEFLGYEIVRKDKHVAAKHQKYFNLVLQDLGFGVLFTAFFGINPLGKRSRGSVLECLNTFNQKAGVCRCYVDKDFDLVIEADYPHSYERGAFGVFIDALNNDLRLLGNEEVNLRQYLE